MYSLFLYGGCQVGATGLASPLRFQDPQVKVRSPRGTGGGEEDPAAAPGAVTFLVAGILINFG